MRNKKIILNGFLILILTLALLLKVTNYIDNIKLIVTFLLIVLSITLSLLIKPNKKLITKVLDITTFVISTISIFLIITNFIVFIAIVEGSSMKPTFVDGNRFAVYKLFVNVELDDIVVYKNSDDLIVKRVAALENDIISIESIILNGSSKKVLVINGEYHKNKYEEYYIIKDSDKITQLELPYTLKSDEIILLGDNQSFSKDSREEGIYLLKNIVGKKIGD